MSNESSARRPRILLVVGAAHGGTTITAMVLAQHPDVFGSGELSRFPDGDQFVPDNRCGCGEAAAACGFWAGIREATGARIGEGAVDIGAVYQAIINATGAAAIVDVCHGQRRARELARRDDIDLFVVKVVRPVDAVAHSQVRVAVDRKRVSDTLPSRLRVAARAALDWKRIGMTVTEAELGCPVIELDYEALCNDPATELRRVGEHVGVDYSATSARFAAGDRRIEKPRHMIRGNRKLRSLEHITLRPSEGGRALRAPERLARAVAAMPWGLVELFRRTSRPLRRGVGA